MATDEEMMMARIRSFLPRRIAAPVNPVLDPTEAEATGQPSLDTSVQNTTGMNPNVERLNLLPRYSAKDGLVAPSIIYDAARAITAPGHQLRHGNLGPSEAMETALGTMGGGMGASGAVGAPTGALGMFIGPKAKLWDRKMNDKALAMEQGGAKDREIWHATGNWRAPDTKWRQEIPDDAANFTAAIKSLPDQTYAPVKNLYTHPIMDAAYPDIMKNTHMNVANAKVHGGSFSPVKRNVQTVEQNKGFMDILRGMVGKGRPNRRAFEHTINVKGPNENSALGTTAHELQHNVQQVEGFAGGGNTHMHMEGALNRAVSEMNKSGGRITEAQLLARNKLADDYAYADYLRMAGEAEARATNARRHMTTAERRAKFPEDSYDVPIGELNSRAKYD